MDSLYEHVHDDGDLIQGSAGETNNFSWPTKDGEEKIASYKEHSTTTDIVRRLRGMNRTLDPLEHLPAELSTFVIVQALPPQGVNSSRSTHSSRLIELTTVSKKWQSFIFSTPILWSELVIDEKQEDFLATLSLFVTLSSNVLVQLFLRGKLTGIDWTVLASTLLPSAKRVTCFHFIIVDDDDFEWVPNALSNLLERLCPLPRLKEVKYITNDGERVSLLHIKSLGLPSGIRFSCRFRIELPEGCWDSETHSRFFDVTKCKSLGTSGQLVLSSQPNSLLFKYRTHLNESKIISNGSTLSQVESLAKALAECNCFEQVVYRTSSHLYHLQVGVDISQTEDLLDCLQMLIQLQVLELQIGCRGRIITRNHTFSDTTSRNLKKFQLNLTDGVEDMDRAQRPLGDLFSALETLYPGVEELRLSGSNWISLATYYLQSLQVLNSLVLAFGRSPFTLPWSPITLQSMQCLEMQGVPHLDNLCTPNLLKLVLELGPNVLNLDHLGPFPSGLQSLAITLNGDMKDFELTSVDCPDLRDLHLEGWIRRTSWGRPWLSNLVSIKVGSDFRRFTDSSSSQLCITLLCHPWQLPSLRQLHFLKCVEWDLLFLMLKRRNCDKSRGQRIDTVTLPFIPFAFHKLLAGLLAGEIVELPSLISLSLEATREVMFDASVPGCFACMNCMRPGCKAIVAPGRRRLITPVDMLYPPEEPIPEETPQEIRDWLRQRWKLVEVWKVSYKVFTSRFEREESCNDFPRGSL